jgi:hypothetical protein
MEARLGGRPQQEPDEVVPDKILPFAVKSVEEVARSRLSLFNAVGKALH